MIVNSNRNSRSAMGSRFPGSSAKTGVLKTEALLSLFILLTAMNVVSPMVHRINQLCSSARQHQFAIHELSNQMESLVWLSPEEVQSALDSIDVSPACKQTLRGATISGVLDEDKEDVLGPRITLKLSWSERPIANPVSLSAWLESGKSAPEEASAP